MAKAKLALHANLADHDYDLTALHEACDEEDIEEMEEESKMTFLNEHTPPAPTRRDSKRKTRKDKMAE